ncbi:uncharacterized protein A1O9_07653 [Exophiala aquamarina CBS 119918]|uniref:Matrin-type domain-containing protein n=1 Tax=Exophiala aquamarina CBS 119918 TaxID=1182545 RepID=A0A072P8J7_9EURO|nr:uncharacterized protein A1O9_07653 [Exophiala aquamarina CBS 119918]KEF56072.1 hypothetical protein A1O9_07653 [Exophiala aquamarina CBS 119918]
MSEYWKSTPKYWCKHCSTYVKDTPFERKQHESTAKHQSNLKRFLRDIQNGHERSERDKQRAKAEVDRLKGTFGSSSSDPANTLGSGAQPAPQPSRISAPVFQSAADQKRQWAQLADLGIKVPEQVRSEMAMAGDWAVISNQPVIEEQREQPLSVGVKKRKLEGQEEEEETGEREGIVARPRWGATTRRFPGYDEADLDGLLSGSISTAKRDKPTAPPSRSPEGHVEAADQIKVTPLAAAGDRASTPVKLEGGQPCRVVKSEDDVLRKEELCRAQRGAAVDNIPEELPMPVFKRRKAKVS